MTTTDIRPGDNPSDVDALMASGKLAIRRFDLDSAQRQFAAVSDVATATADKVLEATALAWGALVDVELTAYDLAEMKAQRALSIFERERDAVNVGHAKDTLGILAAERGDYEGAAELFAQSIAAYDDAPNLIAWVHVDLAQLCLLRGDLRGSREYAKRSHKAGRDLDDKGLCAWAANLMGLAEVASGDYEKARDHQGESLTLAMEQGNVRVRIRALEGFAVLAAKARQDKGAVTLLAAIDQARTALGLPRANTEKRLISDVDAARSRMPDETVIDAQNRGRRMSLDQATDLARRSKP